MQEVRQVLGDLTDTVVTTVLPVTAPLATAVATLPVMVSAVAGALASGSPLGFTATQTRTLLEAVGLKRRRRVWGTLYDAKTKHPLAYAKVELLDASSRLLETRYADQSGRYGFLTSPPSLLASATQVSIRPVVPDYAFPSKLVSASSDFVVYDHLYHGGLLTLSPGALVNANLPLDPQRPTVLPSRIPEPRTLVRAVTSATLNVVFWIGLVTVPLEALTHPSPLTLALLLLFILANAVRIATNLYRPFGIVRDAATHRPLAYALVTLTTAQGKRTAFSVADAQGRYFLLADPGTYTLTVSTPAQITPPRSVHRTLTAPKGWVRVVVGV